MKPKTRKAGSESTLAQRADKHKLYLAAVQTPEVETGFLDRAYRAEFKSRAMLLREDFCGSGAVCHEWVRSLRGRKALGVDLDQECMDWGRANLGKKLTEAQRQAVTYLRADVRDVQGPKADIVTAGNFSYYILRRRADLLAYFQAAYRNLKEQGVLVLDHMGGSDCLIEDQEEAKQKRGFTYVWQQEKFNPITHESQFHIHFRFKDGSEVNKAFSYEWRLWSIPELLDILRETEFGEDVHVYWEDSDARGVGTGVFRKRKYAPADAVHIAYIVAVKRARRE